MGLRRCKRKQAPWEVHCRMEDGRRVAVLVSLFPFFCFCFSDSLVLDEKGRGERKKSVSRDERKRRLRTRRSRQDSEREVGGSWICGFAGRLSARLLSLFSFIFPFLLTLVHPHSNTDHRPPTTYNRTISADLPFLYNGRHLPSPLPSPGLQD